MPKVSTKQEAAIAAALLHLLTQDKPDLDKIAAALKKAAGVGGQGG